MGHDFWSYGVGPNRKVLDYFLAQHHAEGLSERRVAVDELFHPANMRRSNSRVGKAKRANAVGQRGQVLRAFAHPTFKSDPEIL